VRQPPLLKSFSIRSVGKLRPQSYDAGAHRRPIKLGEPSRTIVNGHTHKINSKNRGRYS